MEPTRVEQGRYGSRNHRYWKVGVFHLREKTVFDVPQEYAGACEQVEVEPGEYLVERGNDWTSHDWYIITLPGTRVHYSWHSSHCHVLEKDRVPQTHHKQLYSYQIAELILSGAITPDEGWGTVPHEYESGGEPRTMHFLTCEGVTLH